MSRNPYVFVIGCPRSGTTLLQRMLNAHPHLAVTNEMDIGLDDGLRRTRHSGNTRNDPPEAEPVGITRDGFVTQAFVEQLLASRRVARHRFDADAVRRLVGARPRLSYAEFVSRLFDLYAAMRGKELAGDKTPRYVQWVSDLHSLWPDARFVHVIRDGRDIYLSMRDWRTAGPTGDNEGLGGDFRRGDYIMSRFRGWNEDPVVTIALWWKWRVLLGRQHGEALDPALYHEIRYEDLVSDPATMSRALCSFLDLPYREKMVNFAEGRTKSDPRLASKHRWLPPTPGLRAWRTQMSPEAVQRFEAVAGDLLDELGYGRGTPRISPTTMRSAGAVAGAFVEGLREKGLPLPARLWSQWPNQP